jgi:AcrR family transcriptional regulator
MARKTRTRARERQPLNRERVLKAGLQLADEAGLESLSMRRLGQMLGVEAMSLYNHVASKEDLLDGLADIAIEEIEVSSEGLAWKEAMRRRAISVHEMLVRHPWASSVIESRTNPSAARSRYPEQVVAILRRAGFSPEMALHAFFTLDSYIYGFVVQEENMPSGTPEELAEMAGSILSALPAREYPYLHEIVVDHVMKAGFSYADEFAFGLDLILDGLERARDAA